MIFFFLVVLGHIFLASLHVLHLKNFHARDCKCNIVESQGFPPFSSIDFCFGLLLNYFQISLILSRLIFNLYYGRSKAAFSLRLVQYNFKCEILWGSLLHSPHFQWVLLSGWKLNSSSPVWALGLVQLTVLLQSDKGCLWLNSSQVPLSPLLV